MRIPALSCLPAVRFLNPMTTPGHSEAAAGLGATAKTTRSEIYLDGFSQCKQSRHHHYNAGMECTQLDSRPPPPISLGHSAVNSLLPLQPPETPDLLFSVPMVLPFPNRHPSSGWDHTVCGLLCLSPFIQRHVLFGSFVQN